MPSSSSLSSLRRPEGALTVPRGLLGTEVTERVRGLIRSGELPPGTHLVETTLAELLGVSRGPVREALRTLDREGLVVISPHKGAVVAEWDLRDLLDAYDVRALLEVKAMELATERAPARCAEELTELLATWDTAVRADDRERCADLDFDFHRAIWRHARNRCLSATLKQTIYPLQTVFYLNTTRYDDLRKVVALHQRLRDAIATGEAAVARGAMAEHMEHSLRKARRHSERLRD